jgi:hypothetical protein
MPISKHRRRRKTKRLPEPEQSIGELLCRLVDDRCLELYGKREWIMAERDAALEQLTEDFVREYGQS